MDIDFAAGDILQDALVGGRLAPDVVVLRQAIDRNRHARARQAHPLHRDGDDAAGHHQREDAHAAEDRKDFAELAVTHERLSAHQRYVQRAMLLHQVDDAAHQLLAAEIAELPQGHITAQVGIPVGVAARTGERAFASDLDREHRGPAAQDAQACQERFVYGKSRAR